MSALSGEPRSTCDRRNSRLRIFLLLLPTTCLFGRSAQTGTYVFVADQSKLVQTGGIAHVQWTYSVEGQFQLAVDANAGTASFVRVDANATDDSPFKRTLDPNRVFNVTSLVGTVVDDATIKFTGKASDGSDILITLSLADNVAHLIGQTTPPPNSADFFIFSLDALAKRKYASGSGTAEHPYQIATPDDLIALGETPEDYDKHFTMTADIDLAGHVFDKAVIAPDTDPKTKLDFEGSPFTGVLDGKGHIISNLMIEIEGAARRVYYVGLFGCVRDPSAKVKNLRLLKPAGSGSSLLVGLLTDGTISNCHVQDCNLSGPWPGVTGGLVMYNYGTIADCHVSGQIIADGHWAAGLVGLNGTDGTITQCSFSGSVQGGCCDATTGGLVAENSGGISFCYSTGSVSGPSPGGLVGCNSGVVYGCYSTSDVQGGFSGAGGLVCGNSGIISNCYSAGAVSGAAKYVGGLVAWNSGSVTCCFWDMQTSGQTTSAGGIGLTTAEMQRVSTFVRVGWDFKEVWDMAENQTYPFLRSCPVGDLNYDCRSDLLDLAILAEHWLAGIE